MEKQILTNGVLKLKSSKCDLLFLSRVKQRKMENCLGNLHEPPFLFG